MQSRSLIRLAAPEGTASELFKSKTLKGNRKGRRRTRMVTLTCFDTPRHLLRLSGISLIVRDTGPGLEQSVKVAAGDHAGLHGIREWTAPLPAGATPTLDFVDEPAIRNAVSRRAIRNRIKPLFRADFTRRSQRFKFTGCEFELFVDQGSIETIGPGRCGGAVIDETGIELLSGNAGGMLEAALALCEAHDLRLLHMDRLERGYLLVRPSLKRRPSKGPPVLLSTSMSVGEAFRHTVGQTLEHLFLNEAPTLRGDPEGVHQTRVAMRRLRAALGVYKRILPYDKRKAFNGELRWFAQRLAPSRDWHVFLTESLPRIEKHAGGPIEELRAIASAERRRTTREAVELLQSRRYTRLLLKFETWLANLESDSQGRPFSRPVKPFARATLNRAFRRFFAESRPLSRLPADDLHELRKLGKKARYTSEFFQSLWDEGEVRAFVKILKQIQDQLGEANDAAVARQVITTLRPGRVPISLVHAIETWSQKQIESKVRKAQPSWRRLRRLDPFWTIRRR